ncbi:MAG: efflux RND transporter periplasmic adaptor subunit [Defluviicoccus sp.]|nr:efflux RND transporter periplasmic adaptor subunit [Defluviicoccus sp.]MDG4608298.1 efflux RND transporter periplasmic adaptor subunit [Defluviicoccus sp.]
MTVSWFGRARPACGGILAVIVGAMTALAPLIAPAPAAADEPVLVVVDAVRSEPLSETVPVIGRLVALESGDIATRVPGTVAQVAVRVGERVKAGAVLATLIADRATAERDLRAAEVAAAEAAVASARARLALKRQEVGRLDSLKASPAFGEARYLDLRQEVQIAEAELAQAEATVAPVRAQLRLAEIALADSTIRAPYDGVVTRRFADVGAYLQTGAPVASLIDDQLLEVEADVPAPRLAGLTSGAGVQVQIDDSRVPASVRAVLPVENTQTRTRTVRFRTALDAIHDRAANRAVTVHIPAAPRREALTVHKDAILYRAGQTQVFRAADGHAALQTVRLGDATFERFEVLDGLTAGDVVIIRGNERLKPDQEITISVGSGG